MSKKIFFPVVLWCISFALKAEIEPSHIFGSNMVIQRNQPIVIFGTGKSGEKVKVSFNNIVKSTRVNKSGTWQVTLPQMSQGEGLKLSINKLSYTGIVIGDIWLCSGQSNMEYTIKRFKYAQVESDSANYDKIRYFKVERTASFTPEDQLPNAVWTKAIGDSIKEFSAVAYFYARKIYQETGVPIGLISSNWGGTNVEAWTPIKTLQQIPSYQAALNKYRIPQHGNAEKGSSQLSIINNLLNNGIGSRENWESLDDSQYDNWDEVDLPNMDEKFGLDSLGGVVWATRKLEIPYHFLNNDLDLRLGKINECDKVWVNGELIGQRKDLKRWRTYTIPKRLLKKESRIVIQFLSTQQNLGFMNDEDYLHFSRSGNSAGIIPIAGTWKFKKAQKFTKKVEMPATFLNDFHPNKNPSSLYNGMIYPLRKVGISGVIWYQGESNTKTNPTQYSEAFKNMILSWRQLWKSDFPFLYVQLANFKPRTSNANQPSTWALLREAQASIDLPNTFMATAVDIGNGKNIHPANKQEVGRRLALASLSMYYTYPGIKFHNPTFRSMEVLDKGNAVRINFNNADGLKVVGDQYGYLKGFKIAGSDKKFYWAIGTVEDGSVIIKSNKVKKPVAVRYAWSDNPEDANLKNKYNLPVIPFRTDQWITGAEAGSYLD